MSVMHEEKWQDAVAALTKTASKNKDVVKVLEAMFNLAIEVNKQGSLFTVASGLEELEDALGAAYNNYISGTEWQIKK